MNAEGVHLRVSSLRDQSAYNYDYLSSEKNLKNRTFYIPRGAKLYVPDEYVVHSSDGQPDIKKSIDNWYKIEQSAVRKLRLNDNGNAVKGEDRKTDSVGNFMAVSSHTLNTMNPNIDLPKTYQTAYIDFQKILADNPKALSLKQEVPVAQQQQQSASAGRRRITPIKLYGEAAAKVTTAATTTVAAQVRSEPARPAELATPPTLMSTPSHGDSSKALMCVQNGENKCENVKYDLENLKKDHFTSKFCSRGHCDYKARVFAFADYMAPIAQYFQAKTGLPASVMIAQAMLETAYGTSYLFNNKEALFGESCVKFGTARSRNFEIDNEAFSAKGSCLTNRPKNEGYYYVNFDSKESSVASYIHNLLLDPRTKDTYGGVRAAVKEARTNNPNGVASWQKVVPHLSRYATNKNYVQDVASTIRNLGLEKYDKNSCQNCIEQRESNKKVYQYDKAAH